MSGRAALLAGQEGFSAVAPVSGVLQRKCAGCGNHTMAGGECAECGKRKGLLQRRSRSEGDVNEVPAIVYDVLGTSGQPLDHATRAFMEPRFRHDFSGVRVHANTKAAESARAVNAAAYTVGRDIVFDAGQFDPLTSVGRSLVAHELTHVVQQGNPPTPAGGGIKLGTNEPAEHEASHAEAAVTSGASAATFIGSSLASVSGQMQRRVNRNNVSCQASGLTNPGLTGDEVVAALEAADAEAITLALRAELLLDSNLLFARAGEPVDADFDTILQEELGLTLTNPAHFQLIEQQSSRFRRVRETLESGYLRYICRGGTVSLVGCRAGTCGEDFAFTCPGNRLVVLCQAFWDNPDQRAATILHEPFHIWFHMARHADNALRRADSTCFESFALRVAGQAAFASCAGHTAG